MGQKRAHYDRNFSHRLLVHIAVAADYAITVFGLFCKLWIGFSEAQEFPMQPLEAGLAIEILLYDTLLHSPYHFHCRREAIEMNPNNMRS
jgi:hypothetical protein